VQLSVTDVIIRDAVVEIEISLVCFVEVTARMVRGIGISPAPAGALPTHAPCLPCLLLFRFKQPLDIPFLAEVCPDCLGTGGGMSGCLQSDSTLGART